MTGASVPFHRLAAGRSAWRALAEAALLTLFAIAIQVAVLLAVGVQLGSLLFDLALIAATLPAPFIAAWAVRRSPAELLSAQRRFRWGLLARAGAAALVVYVPAVAFAGAAATADWSWMALLALVVPLQAAAEEFTFRASLPQVVGTWARSPWVAYGQPGLAFLLLHGSAASPGVAGPESASTGSAGAGAIFGMPLLDSAVLAPAVLDIAVFAACAAFLAWRTNGVEAPIALHAVGNVAAAALPVPVTVSTALTLAATALIYVVCAGTRRGLHRSRRRDAPGSAPESPPRRGGM